MTAFEFGPNQKKWLEALESGEFKQGYDCFKKFFENSIQHCALGVCVEILKGPGQSDSLGYYHWDGKYMLRSIPDMAFNDSGVRAIMYMNDIQKMTFAEIASHIRNFPKTIFHTSA